MHARRSESPCDARIAAFSARQQRNITRRQLEQIGVSRSAITHRVRAGRLHRVHPGVYSVGTPPITPLERASAAALACGEDAALSHGSAMTLWGLWKRWDMPFEVSLLTDRRPRGIRAHHPTTLHHRDLKRHFGIRVTSPARTLHDISRRLTDRQLSTAVNAALVSPYLTTEQLGEFLARRPSPRLAQFVPDAGSGPTRSELERDFLTLCEQHGLPTPQTNVIVNGYLVDAYFPEHRVIVELDGWGFHSTRHSFENDRSRDADQLGDGIPTLRITHRRITSRPAAEAARLERILAGRA